MQDRWTNAASQPEELADLREGEGERGRAKYKRPESEQGSERWRRKVSEWTFGTTVARHRDADALGSALRSLCARRRGRERRASRGHHPDAEEPDHQRADCYGKAEALAHTRTLPC